MAYKQQEERQQEQQQEQQQQFVGPVLYISRTHKNIRQERIFAVIRQLKLGWVGKIDMVPKKNMERKPDGTVTTREFLSVFIHFTKWFTQNQQTREFLERLDSQGFVHIVYDEPWFWKVTKYVPKEHKPRPQSRYPKPRIDFGGRENVQNVQNVQKIKPSSPSSSVTPIVPVQLTRRLQNVSSVSVGNENDSKNKYWRQQAEIATAATMKNHCSHYCSLSSSSSSRSSHTYKSPQSLSSPSPIENIKVRLFHS